MADNIKKIIAIIATIVASLCAGYGVKILVDPAKIEVESHYAIEFAEDQVPAVIEDDRGELVEDENIPTVEEVDGGQFEDITTGVSVQEGDYADLGWSETYDTSSPEAFKRDTLGKCIIANNRYGAQCVSLARVFWWSYADRDVSTCGTGMAKGMMNCAEQNAGDDFEIIWDKSKIQAGTWVIFNGGTYGHVGMALGPVVNGYVALLGENQGGKNCGSGVGGAGTNIINISVKNFVGGYTPKDYIKPEPTPEPTPEPESCDRITVKKGDTLGDIMKRCEGEIKWGKAMNDYAKSWKSTKYMLYPTVYDGWVSEGHYGLFAGDVIERTK